MKKQRRAWRGIPSEGFTRVSVILPVEVHEALKAQAKARGLGQSALVEELIRKYLESSQTEPVKTAAV